MTSSEISARIAKRIDDNTANPLSVTPAEILAAVNEGQELAAWLTLCLETEKNITLAQNGNFIQIRATFPDYLVPLRLEANGSRLRPGTLADFDGANEKWQSAAGTPDRYATLGFNVLVVNQQPVNDVVAQMTYARAPVPMVGDVSPEIPEAYHIDLIDYSLYKLRLKEGAQGLARGMTYLNRFLDRMTALADYVRARSRAARYDTLPFELRLFDRAQLLTAQK
jgi:hypothetical protein